MTPKPPPAGVPRPVPPPGYLARRWFSLKAALAGVRHTFTTQPNAVIELAALAIVCLAGWWLEITRLEWAVIGLVIAVILALEAVNTAIEAVVDLVSPRYHPLAQIAKDTAAGAMVLAVLGSIWVALFLLGPPLWERLFGS